MKRRLGEIAGVLILPLLVAACSSPSLQIAAGGRQCPPPAERALASNELLHYHTCLASLRPAELSAEYDGVQHELEKSGNASHRIRLALLLSWPDTAYRSIPTALDMLKGVPEDGVPGGLGDLAALLRESLIQQQLLDDKAQGLKKELAVERAHAGSLQDKIDSIKDLERNMTQSEMP